MIDAKFYSHTGRLLMTGHFRDMSLFHAWRIRVPANYLIRFVTLTRNGRTIDYPWEVHD